MSSYIKEVWPDRYACIDNYYWHNNYWYVLLEKWETWETFEIWDRKVLNELEFNKINSKNYNPTLDSKIMATDYILTIIGLRRLDEESRMRYVKYLDEKLKFRTILESLNFVIPAENLGWLYVWFMLSFQ